MTLIELVQKNTYSTDKGTDHTYLNLYDELFKPFQHKAINLLEVGYATGGSIKLWEDYFDKANIRCIDINSKFNHHSNRVTLWNHDINKVTENYFKDFKVDIAIDDGSHLLTDQVFFVQLVYPHLKKGGLLIVEDIHDIDNNGKIFKQLLGIPFEIIDLRYMNNRHDNVLILIRK